MVYCISFHLAVILAIFWTSGDQLTWLPEGSPGKTCSISPEQEEEEEVEEEDKKEETSLSLYNSETFRTGYLLL